MHAVYACRLHWIACANAGHVQPPAPGEHGGRIRKRHVEERPVRASGGCDATRGDVLLPVDAQPLHLPAADETQSSALE